MTEPQTPPPEEQPAKEAKRKPMAASSETRSAGSRRGHQRRQLRERIRRHYLLELASGNKPKLLLNVDQRDMPTLAKWVADNAPTEVIDALEEAEK